MMNITPFSSTSMQETMARHRYEPWEFMLRLDQVSHDPLERMAISHRLAAHPRNIASGVNSYAPPPFLLREAARALEIPLFCHAYDDPRGHVVALRSIQAYEHFTSGQKLEVGDDCVMLTHGASMALHLIALYFAEAYPACDLLVAVPTYPLAPATMAFAGLHVTEVFHDGPGRFLPTLAEFAAAASSGTRLILINIFNNPTGECYERSELAAILAWAAERGMMVLVDKVSCDIDLHTPAPNILDMAAEIGCRDRIIVISSLSKDRSLPGFRLGWIVAPASVVTHLSRFNALISMMCTSPMSAVLFIDMLCRTLYHAHRLGVSTRSDDRAIAAAFIERAKADTLADLGSDRLLEPYLDDSYRSQLFHEYWQWRTGLTQLLHTNLRIIEEWRSSGLTIGARCDGGFNTFVRLPMVDHRDPRQFTIDLFRHTGVQIMPGPAFGGGVENWQSHLGFWTRISFAMDTEALRNGIAQLVAYARNAPDT